MKIPRLSTLGLVSLAVLLLAAALPVSLFRLSTVTALEPAGVKEALSWLRSGLSGGQTPRLPGGLSKFSGDRVPLVLTVWKGGFRHKVFQVDDKTFAEGLRGLAASLGELGADRADPSLRLQLDAAVGVGPVPKVATIQSFSFAEGHDGLVAEIGGRKVLVPPSVLVKRNVYASLEILPGYNLEFKTGLDHARMLSAVRSQGRALGIAEGTPAVTARFRALTAVEGDDLSPKILVSGTVERPDPDRARVEAAVRAGADYLVNALDPDGEFRYIFDPLDDYVPKDYSWARHFGSAYSLALCGRILGEPRYLDAATLAIERGVRRLRIAPVGGRCLFGGERCYLGDSALMLLAISEHAIAAGGRKFETAGADLAAFLRAMQRKDGLFFHFWHSKGGVDRGSWLLYASQQGVLALARHARATGDREAASAAVRGMDRLAGGYWDFFLGKWFFAAEHWSCLAAEEVYAQAPKPRYAEFCREIGMHYERTILRPDETPFAENAGGMVVTHAISPHGCGTATASEAMTSAVALGTAAGLDVAAVKEAALLSYAFLLRTQVNAHDGFWIRRPGLAAGGFYEKQIVPRVRIDNVQHAISALVRGIEFYPPAEKGATAAAFRDFSVTAPR